MGRTDSFRTLPNREETPMPFRALLPTLLFALLPGQVLSDEMRVAIRADFPGGNVKVVKNEGSAVDIAPDLRGGPVWFYWHFEAEASQPGTVTFDFANPPMIGVRGPAVGHDGGKSWNWLGAEHVTYAPTAGNDKTVVRKDRFAFRFTEAKQKVRFAVAIPYLQGDLDAFLAKHAANTHLKRSVLTKTRVGGREVDLLQIGKPGEGVQAVLLTARHHACESLASYVLEGILQEAMSDSLAGIAFRQKYVIYAVPLVDGDGVHAGDQGKNRPPHDHNRDYGKESIYSEIIAIQDLAELRDIRFSLDLHCPYLRGDIHEAFHFLGLGVPHIKDNVNELSAWLNEERPRVAMTPINLLTDPAKPGAENRKINSHYFATRKNAVFAATLEIPYAQPNTPSDPAMARAYGASILKAWVRTKFVTAAEDTPRGTKGHADLVAFRNKFLQTFRANPKEAESLANVYLEAKDNRGVHRAEANYLMAMMRLHEKKYAESLRFCKAVSRDTHATTSQQSSALLVAFQAVCGDPKSTAGDVDSGLADVQRFPHWAAEQQAKVLETASDYYFSRKEYGKSLDHSKQQLAFVAKHEYGRQLNRIATIQELHGKPDDAVASRKEAVKILSAQLRPTPPRSIFGAMMANDLFEAVCGIPTSTVEEKKAAAAMVLNHEIAPAALKEKVRKALAELDKHEARTRFALVVA